MRFAWNDGQVKLWRKQKGFTIHTNRKNFVLTYACIHYLWRIHYLWNTYCLSFTHVIFFMRQTHTVSPYLMYKRMKTISDAQTYIILMCIHIQTQQDATSVGHLAWNEIYQVVMFNTTKSLAIVIHRGIGARKSLLRVFYFRQ